MKLNKKKINWKEKKPKKITKNQSTIPMNSALRGGVQ
jgi:hypothetical protein